MTAVNLILRASHRRHGVLTLTAVIQEVEDRFRVFRPSMRQAAVHGGEHGDPSSLRCLLSR